MSQYCRPMLLIRKQCRHWITTINAIHNDLDNHTSCHVGFDDKDALVDDRTAADAGATVGLYASHVLINGMYIVIFWPFNNYVLN